MDEIEFTYRNERGFARILYEIFHLLEIDGFSINVNKIWIYNEIDSDKENVNNNAWRKFQLNRVNKIIEVNLLLPE
jgi:hypothetical protein